MHTSILIAAGVVAALSLFGCCSSKPGSLAAPPSQAAAPTTKLAAASSSIVRRPVPGDLPSFGEPSAATIRVAVFGMEGTVRRPGYYYLPRGAVVRDAVVAAQGLGEFTWWRIYSGLERSKPDGSFDLIRFTRNRRAEEQIELQDGDRLYCGHEAY